jgi:uncharacterized protein YdcH (DUF465 family)
MDLKNQILVALGLNKEEVVSLEWQAKSEDGSTIFVSTADELAEGVDVSVLTEDGSTILLPPGSYSADGVTFVVVEEGIVDSIETEEEVAEEGAPIEEEEMAEESTEDLEVEDDAFERLVERVQNLEDAIADLKADKVEATEEVEELSEEEVRGTTPKSIKTTEVVEFSIEDLKAENERLKTELAAQPASAPLDTNKFSSERKPMSKKDYAKLSKRERFLHDLNK